MRRAVVCRKELSRFGGRTIGRMLRYFGPGFVKFGQLLSTRRDLLLPSICSGLEDVLIARGTGYGSVAYVRRGWSADAECDTALKYIRPDARVAMRKNLKCLVSLGRLAGCLPGLRGLRVAEIVLEISDVVTKQLDLDLERRSLIGLRTAIQSDQVHIPRVFVDSCSSHVLAMEWMHGACANPLARFDAAGCEHLMEILTRTLLRMISVHGLVHCDLHPGNWWPIDRDCIAIVDAGFMYELSAVQQWRFIEFMFGMILGDGEHSFRHLIADIDIDQLPVGSSMKMFREDIVRLVEQQYRLSVDDFDLAKFGASLFAIFRKYRFRGEPSFIFPLIALLCIEGQLKEFASTLDFQQIAREELSRPLLKLRSEHMMGRMV